MKMATTFYNTLRRKRPLGDGSLTETKLARVLNTLDLTALGIGSTLGVGVYVLAGSVSMTLAGPGVVLSFLIAAIASMFAGICYAEFGARVPRAGSAYVYSYVCIGEFIAFIVGWNLILEYVIGAASVVKALSLYIDALFDKVIQNYFIQHVPIDVAYMAQYPDFFAFGLTALFTSFVAFGAKESTIFNNIFTALNLTVVLYVIITGLFKVDAKNWSIPEEDVPEGFGTGGFAPYGIAGIIKGAATCFYGFIGFDCVATAGEEAKNPKKSIPIAVVGSLTIIFFAYFGISTVLTMMLPYYNQDEEAPLPHVFKTIGWTVAQYIVSIGATFGLCSSLLGALFPLPRVIYAMSSDGLIYEFLGRIFPRFKTPLLGTLLAGLLAGTLAMLIDLDRLVHMMSIGTLLAYSMVAASVVILRYEVDIEHGSAEKQEPITVGGICRQLLNTSSIRHPSAVSSFIVTWGMTAYCMWCLGIAACISNLSTELENLEVGAIAAVTVFGVLLLCTIIIIWRQPQSPKELSFTVPLLPFLPGLSILINIYLMVQLDGETWVQFAVWILIGIFIYFTYGIWNSNERVSESKHTCFSYIGSIFSRCIRRKKQPVAAAVAK